MSFDELMSVESSFKCIKLLKLLSDEDIDIKGFKQDIHFYYGDFFNPLHFIFLYAADTLFSDVTVYPEVCDPTITKQKSEVMKEFEVDIDCVWNDITNQIMLVIRDKHLSHCTSFTCGNCDEFQAILNKNKDAMLLITHSDYYFDLDGEELLEELLTIHNTLEKFGGNEQNEMAV